MKLKSIKLRNGLPVFAINLPQSKTVTILMMYKTGSKYENREISGLSHFIEHMMFKGTKKRPSTLILSSELDSLGAEFNAFTAKEYTGFYIKVPKNKINNAIDILSDILLNSKFDSEEIEREKGVIISELNMYEDDPKMNIEDVFESCLYGDSPAGWDAIGTKESINSFKREDFIKYFSSQYGVNSSAVFLAGNFSEKNVKNVLEKKFSKMSRNNYKNKIKVIEKQDKPNLKIKTKKTDQNVLALGFRAFSNNYKDEPTLKILSVILGGSMSSRLFIELRERRGLAYFARTNTELYTDSGYIAAYAGVSKDKLEESIKVILNEFQKMKETLVTPAELKKAKDLIAGRLIVSMEQSDDYSSWYGQQFIFKKEFISPEERLKKLKKVSATDIKKLAKKLFVNDSLNLSIIGEVKDEKKIKNILKIK